MALDIRTAQTTLENLLRDTILQALGQRLPAVVSIAALRAVTTAGSSSTFRSNDDLINVVVSGIVTAAYRWNSESVAADDGANVIKPTDVTTNGRWLLWTSPVRFVPVIGGNSFFLHQLLGGPLRKVILLDRALSEDEVNSLILGQMPAVVIEASGDDPKDMQEASGYRYDTSYDFKVSVIAENLRDRREAAQGSPSVLGDTDPGANALDGFVKALLAGVNLSPAEIDIRDVQIGRGDNFISELGQRRVVRERSYKLLVTETNPAAPNDAGLEQDVTIQAQMTDLHEQITWDSSNYVAFGILVVPAAGLTQSITSGSAVVTGTITTYAGGSRTFATFSDTYRDLNPNGTLTFVVTTNGGEEPPVTVNALRIGVSTTNGASVVSDRYIANTKQNYCAQFDIPL